MDRTGKSLIGVIAILLTVLFAACGSPQTGAPITLVITSVGISASGQYQLTGLVESADLSQVDAEYSINKGDWQALELDADGAFRVTLALEDGSNLITVVASNGDRRVEKSLTVTVDSSGGPQVVITSGDYTESAEYYLAGVAFDDVAVTSLDYSLAGGEPVALDLAGGRTFTAELVLEPGSNHITVSASDADGNTSTAEVNVNYAPQIGDVTVSPMIAQSGENVTISGSAFGSAAGSVHFGDSEAEIVSWSDNEVVVTVPDLRPGGWTGVTLDSGVSEYLVEGFFIGLEVTEPDLSMFLASESPPAGTALLLSGSDYTTNQTSDDAEQYLPTYSFFGARTDGDPTTTITGVGSHMLFGVSGVFPVQFQDLNLSTPAGMAFADTGQLTTTALNPIDSQLAFENVRILGPGDGASDSRISIGTPVPPPFLGPSPEAGVDYVYLNGTSISGFYEVAITGQALETNDSKLTAAGITLRASRSALTVRNSELVPSMLLLMNATTEVRIEANEIQCDALCIVGDIFASVAQASVRFEDNQVGPDSTGILGLFVRGDSIVRGNSLSINAFDITVDSGHIEVGANDWDIAEELNIWLRAGADLHFANNANVTTPLFSIEGGTSVIENNSFDFSSAPDDSWPLEFTGSVAPGEDPAPTSVAFLSNSTTGSAMLFNLKSKGGISLQAEIDGNDFDAGLTAAGSVATVTDLVAPSAVTASGNTWGTITDLDEVRALVTYVGSDAGVFVISE